MYSANWNSSANLTPCKLSTIYMLKCFGKMELLSPSEELILNFKALESQFYREHSIYHPIFTLIPKCGMLIQFIWCSFLTYLLLTQNVSNDISKKCKDSSILNYLVILRCDVTKTKFLKYWICWNTLKKHGEKFPHICDITFKYMHFCLNAF